MRKGKGLRIIWLCAAGLVLGGCNSPEPGGLTTVCDSVTAAGGFMKDDGSAAASSLTTDEEFEAWVKEPDDGTMTEADVLPEIDPACFLDFDCMTASDFGGFFQTDYECRREQNLLLEGTEWENRVVHLSGEEPGPSVYIIAGVHGDEEAAWQAGKLLQNISIRAGELYVLSPANRWGAGKEPKSRYVISHEDLNRSFPGDPEGNAAERIAYAVYENIRGAAPELVFDLHEARPVKAGYDFLGSSLIFTAPGGSTDLLMEIVSETEIGRLCGEPYQLYGPGPAGSLNSTVSLGLGIPVITVETSRVYPMERRVSDHLAIVWYTLQKYGMVDETGGKHGI